MHVLVLGAGVVGLTSALRLQEAGFVVWVVAQALPQETVSGVAAAVWLPYKAWPEDRVLAWGARTLDVYAAQQQDPATGVYFRPLHAFYPHPVPDPWWQSAVRVFRHLYAAELRLDYRDGYYAEVPVIETPVYLRYLLQRFEAGGGQLTVQPEGVAALHTLYADNRLIVNCTGLGAKPLVPDATLYPIRGQIVRVSNPGLETCLIDDDGSLGMSYIIPRTHDIILGGTAEAHAASLEPDPAITADILRKCRQLEPRLHDATVLEVKVGLRPGRPAVRLELEPAGPRCAVLHHYGHGGSGYTLAWGCADEVVAQAEAWAASQAV
jgi:D-amino-acid oxidase